MIKKKPFLIAGLAVALLCFILSFGIYYRLDKAKADSVVDMSGASVRLDEDVDSTGIRFHSRILQSEYTSLCSEYGTLTVTTRIVPESLLGEAMLDENTENADILDVDMTGKQFEITVDDTGYYEYRTYIYNIPAARYGETFSAFTYVSAGETVVLKATAAAERSIAEVAKFAYDDLDAVDGGSYTQVGDKYSKYTKEQRSILAEYFGREQVYGAGVLLSVENATDNIDDYPVTEGENAGKYMAAITKSQANSSVNTIALNVLNSRGLAANANYSVAIDIFTDYTGASGRPLYSSDLSVVWSANAALGARYYTYSFNATTNENGELSKEFTGINIPSTNSIHYVKFVDVRLEWQFSVESASIKVLSGTEITLDSETLGLPNLPGDGTISFNVTEIQGAGTTKTVLGGVDGTGDNFTVKSGYFYDIDIAATVGGKTYYGYVQVSDKDIYVFGFEKQGETVLFGSNDTINNVTGQTHSSRETEDGNTRIKMYRKNSVTTSNPVFRIESLLESAGLPQSSSGVSYKVYVDATYYKEEKVEGDYTTNWGLQFRNNAAWVSKYTGRYYAGDATYQSGQFKFAMQCLRNSGIADSYYALDGVNNWIYFDNVVLIPVYTAAPSYADKDFSVASYGAPGTDSGDSITQDKINTYAAAGFNEYLLLGQNSSLDTWTYSGSQAETTVGCAQNAGISDFIIREKTLGDLALYIDLSDRTDEYLYNQVKIYLKRFIELKDDDGNYLIKGVDIGDEPKGVRIDSYARIYKLVKQVAAEVYNRPDFDIYVCLLPAYADLENLNADGSDGGDRYDVYRNYVKTFLSRTGAKQICVDVYPFQGISNPRLIEGYYATMQIVAKECVKAGVDYTFVMQSYAEAPIYRPCKTAANDTALQVNGTIGFGSKNLIFFRYRPKDANFDDAFFVKTDGSTATDVYNAAKTQIEYAQNLADYALNFEYRASAVYADAMSNYTDGVYNDTFKKAIVTATGKATVVTESYDNSHGLYMYMLQNALDTVYGMEDSTITAVFDGYDKVAVIKNGVCSVETLTDNSYSVTLANGEAVYVIPFS